jgi:hypothetical protein
MAEQVLGNEATQRGVERLVLDLVYAAFTQRMKS